MLTKTLKWIQEMYPDLNESELAQKIEELVKCDIYGDVSKYRIYHFPHLDHDYLRGLSSVDEEKLKSINRWSEINEDTEYLPTSQLGKIEAKSISRTPFYANVTMEISDDLEKDEPKFKPGDRVRVTEKLRGHITENEWDDEMIFFIGEELELKELDTDEHKEWDDWNCKFWKVKKGVFEWFIPEDCLELSLAQHGTCEHCDKDVNSFGYCETSGCNNQDIPF